MTQQPVFKVLLVACGQDDVIDGFVEPGVGIGVVAELHADALKIAYQFAGRKMRGAIEQLVFEKMSQAALLFGFVQAAGTNIKVQAVPGFPVAG